MDSLRNFEQLEYLGTNLCDKYRIGYEVESHQLMTKFIDALVVFLEDKKLSDNQLLQQLFTIMLDAQEKKDTLYLADIIQYELLPKIKTLCEEK